jgi:hypothetical protein
VPIATTEAGRNRRRTWLRSIPYRVSVIGYPGVSRLLDEPNPLELHPICIACMMLSRGLCGAAVTLVPLSWPVSFEFVRVSSCRGRSGCLGLGARLACRRRYQSVPGLLPWHTVCCRFCRLAKLQATCGSDRPIT